MLALLPMASQLLVVVKTKRSNFGACKVSIESDRPVRKSWQGNKAIFILASTALIELELDTKRLIKTDSEAMFTAERVVKDEY